MKIFYVKAEPAAGNGPAASAIIVAQDWAQALVLLRKDIDFSGYRMPPTIVEPREAAADDVRRVLGQAASHEIGVYGFTIHGAATEQHAGTPPAAVS